MSSLMHLILGFNVGIYTALHTEYPKGLINRLLRTDTVLGRILFGNLAITLPTLTAMKLGCDTIEGAGLWHIAIMLLALILVLAFTQWAFHLSFDSHVIIPRPKMQMAVENFFRILWPVAIYIFYWNLHWPLF